MELYEFLEKFLPEYEQKLKNARDIVKYNNIIFYDYSDIDYLIEHNFPEALQNFADRICERQREMIIAEYDWHLSPAENIQNFHNVEQPKIDEL